MIKISEMLEKVELDEKRWDRYKVHDNKGNAEWGKKVSGALNKCSWMGSKEDVLDYIEFKESHKEN